MTFKLMSAIRPSLCWVICIIALFSSFATASDVRPLLSAKLAPFTGAELKNGLQRLPRVLGDRFEYWNDDEVGQFHVVVPLPAPPVVEGQAPAPSEPLSLEGYRLHIRLLKQDGSMLAEQVLASAEPTKTHVQVAVASLQPGSYQLHATLEDPAGAAASEPAVFDFTRVDKSQERAAFPTDGVPILLEEQTLDPQAQWPVTAAIPLPLNTVSDVSTLAVFHEGKRVASQVRPAALWSKGGSVQWAHISFVARYTDGKATGYRLRRLDTPTPAPTPALHVEENDMTIIIDTGAVRIQVKRQGYNGIDRAWCDASGQGRYDVQKPTIDASASPVSSPYLIDGRLVRFETQFDKNVTVELEESGPLQATVVARGWYVRDGGSESLCQFVTRITAVAGLPTLRISHHTIITFDTRTTRLADVGFPVAVVGAERYSLGFDGQVHSGELPVIPAQIKPRRDRTVKIPSVYLVQERWDGLRLVGAGRETITGSKSDGWFSVAQGKAENNGQQVALVLRDIWQKFPKEVQLSRQAMTVHLWPAHGQSHFDPAQEVALQNIYKYWSFHQGRMLDLNLPNRYLEVLDAHPESWIEAWPQNALNGNGQGMAMNAEFELALSDASTSQPQAMSQRAQLVQYAPAAFAPPKWSAATNAVGHIDAEDANFADTEEAFLQGMLSYNRGVERGQAYGMWIWPDTHNHWKILENRPNLHRVWHNSHYHQVGSSWLMWLRSASPQMLRWARSANDHYRNVSTINYGELVTDANGRSRWAFMGHIPGAMYHCKAPTPWGACDYGMVRNNDHLSLAAHWTDPDAHLWSWLMSAEPRARDVYEMWHQSVRNYGTMIKGVRREANTTLAVLLTAYQYTHDPDLLPAIHGLGRSLRIDEPLARQLPGPFWHPLWINRYYEQTRDPEYVSFILENADRASLADTWLLGFSALAYEMTGDKKYLTQHFNRIDALPMTMLRAPGDLFDWYGMGPGPLGFRWGEMTWGHFVRQLRKAGISAIKPIGTNVSAYPCASTRPSPNNPAGILVLALETKDDVIGLTLPRRNLHPGLVTITNPQGGSAFRMELKSAQRDRSDTAQQVAQDGQIGLYQIEVRAHDFSLPMPFTNLAHEAARLDENRGYFVNRLDAWIAPLQTPDGPCELVLNSAHDDDAFNVKVFSQSGELIGQGSLLRSLGRTTLSVMIDPSVAGHQPPWRIRVIGPGSLAVKGAGAILMASSPESIAAIRKAIQ